MSNAAEARRRFLLAFIVAWLAALTLGAIASGFTRFLATNAVSVLANGQSAPGDQLVQSFLGAFSNIPSLAAFTAFEIVLSLAIAKLVTAKYPQLRGVGYAVSGALPPFLSGMLLTGFIQWIAMAVGAFALLCAAHLVREPQTNHKH